MAAVKAPCTVTWVPDPSAGRSGKTPGDEFAGTVAEFHDLLTRVASLRANKQPIARLLEHTIFADGLPARYDNFVVFR